MKPPTSLVARSFRVFCLLFALLTPISAVLAKTDVVVLKNGDRITCDIKQLERGQLRVSTDSMGTVYIKWEDVLRLHSSADFIVELMDGSRIVGKLAEASADGRMRVVRGSREQPLDLHDVVWMDPFVSDPSFTERWDGSFSVGVDIARTNRERNLRGAFDLRRRGEDYLARMDGSAFLRSREDRSDSVRANLSASYRGLLEQRWFWATLGSLERNDELGIDLRTLVGAGYGRVLQQSTRSLWSLAGGLALVSEQRAGDDDDENNLEGFLNTRYEYFLLFSPKTTLTAELTVYPSITDSGRFRSNLNFYLRREVISDLFLDLRFYGSQDNRSADEGASTDYGIFTSIGYSF